MSSEPASGASAGLERNQVFTAQDGTQVPFTLVLPADFQPGDEHPILLALPPGSQGQEEVDAGLGRYWEAEALERGWVVVSPVAPGGQLFFEGSERYLPELLDSVATGVRPEGGYYHLAGISNGGLSAFKVANENPELFRSLLVLPGHPPDGESSGGSRPDRGDPGVDAGRLRGRGLARVGRGDGRASAGGRRRRNANRPRGTGPHPRVEPSSIYDFLDGGRPPDGG